MQETKFPHWPLDKIRNNIAKLDSSNNNKKEFYVLLTTGAMNPIHNGHKAALHHCAKLLSSSINNIVIVGAFLSPSSDCYLAGKFRDKKDDFFFPAKVRYEACVKAVEGDELIEIGGYEVSHKKR
jgi:nicotinic acid mononucleotide adenylyltransferase